MCFDGLQLVLSRLALLDIFLAFFVLCAVSCMVADRDWGRDRIARVVPSGSRLAARAWGPLLLWRPWRLATGVFWGLAIGTKWSALFPLAAFGLLMWFWDAGARRSFGVRRALVKSAVVDALPALGYVVLLPAADLRRQLDRVAAARRRLRAAPLQHPVRPLLGQLPAPRRPRVLPRAVAVAALAVALPPRRLRLPHRLPQRQHARLPVRPVGLAGAQPPGRRRHPARHRSPAQQGCAAAAGSTCLRQVLLLGNPVVWWFGDGRGAVGRGRVDRPARLALRARRGRGRGDLAAVAAVRRPADLQLLRDRRSCRS